MQDLRLDVWIIKADQFMCSQMWYLQKHKMLYKVNLSNTQFYENALVYAATIDF